MKSIALILCVQLCGGFVLPRTPRLVKPMMSKDSEQEITDLNLEEMFDVFEAADKEIVDGIGAPAASAPGSNYKGGGANQAESEQRGAILLGFVMLLNVLQFTVPPEIRRTRICTTDQVVGGCETTSAFVDKIKTHYTTCGKDGGAECFKWDFSLEKDSM